MPAIDATTSVLLILATGLLGLALIPVGLPGLWVIVLGILGFGWLTEFRTLGVGSIVTVLGLALLGEAVEAVVGFRYAQRYGGSRRWPRYRLPERATMVFDADSRAKKDPRRWERELFARVPYVQPGS